jgi:hypothetical protein
MVIASTAVSLFIDFYRELFLSHTFTSPFGQVF